MLKKAGDFGMRATVLGLIVVTVGLVGSTFSQMGFLAKRKFGGTTLPEQPRVIEESKLSTTTTTTK
jgi:hypothetical protein